ncbi:MAG: Ig-like domain-containing protein, partial [Armatimonadota bacterium]
MQGPTASTSVPLNRLAEGNHTFEVAAIDEAGNMDPSPATSTFRVDTIAPVFSGLTVTNVAYNSVQVNWTTDDAVAGTVEVALNDGSPFTPILTYLDSRVLTSHAYGIGPLKSNTGYRLRVQSRDAAGNTTTSSVVSFVTPPLRDLSIASGDLSFSSGGPASGAAITVRAAVRNTGDFGMSATLVFYDRDPSGVSREISRHPVTVAAQSANPPVVVSAPVTIGEGTHTLTAVLTSLIPSDDIGTNNGASKELYVGAPAGRLKVTASDQSTFPGDDRLFGVTVRNTGSQPYLLSAPVVTGVSYIVLESSLPDSPLAPGEEVELTFRMLPPAGTPAGPPASPVLSPVTLAIAGFSDNLNVSVYNGPTAQLDVTVLDDATGLPLQGALVASDNSNVLYVTGADGKLRSTTTGQPVLLPATPGVVTVFGYKSDHIAQSITVAAVAGVQSVTLRLAPGQTLQVTGVTARPLTQTEIQQRGVNLTDPANFTVYDFVLYMKIGAISVPNVVVPTGGFASSGGGTFVIPGGSSGVGGSVNIRWNFDPITHTETWIVIPGDVRILKQFWDATVFIRNNSNTLSVEDVNATLVIPNGLALPDLDGVPQSLTQSLGTIGPLEEKQGLWVVRGDRSGSYQLTGRATGYIQLGGTSVPLDSSLTSDPLEVIIPRVSLLFTTPTHVQAGQNFDVGITVKNESPIALNGVSVSIKPAGLLNCLLVSPASQYLGQIAIGGSQQANFTFQSLVTGNVLEVRSYMSPLPVEPDISVIPALNRAPDAVDDSATTLRDTPVTVGVLANDTDPDNNVLSTTSATQGGNGSVVISGSGSLVYTPDSGFVGADSFTYNVSDGHGNSDTATVRVQVVDPNAGPAAITVSGILNMTRSGGMFMATVQLKNTGGSPASNVVVTTAQLGSASSTTSPFPTIGT